MWLLLASLPGLAAGLVGVDWVPFGRDDLAWVEDNQLSGTLVAEGDGLLQPSLRAWGGWTEGQNAVLGNLSGAWLSTESVTSGTTSGARVSALRLGADYRRYLRPRAPGAPVPWLGAGAYGVLPGANTWSDTYSDAEQDSVDETDASTRSRIRGWGGRLGGGVELGWDSGLLVGARADAVLFQGVATAEDSRATTTFWRSEVALTLGFAL